MKHALLAAAFILGACATAQAQTAPCPPAGYTRAQLEALKVAEWAVPSDGARNRLARAMTACLASPDSALRDGLAYEALAHWMRAGALTHETVLAIGDELQADLTAPEGDGYSRPFAALVLSEFARTDRVAPWLTPQRRASLLDASIDYFTHVRDYRGFDDHDGWRHGVAHGSDLLMQLALNPAFGKPELTRIRDAVATQVTPPGHFYIYGEGARLANPILYMAGRGVFTEAEWTAWLNQVASPAPLGSWNQAYQHNSDLARVHDVTQFMQTLYLVASLDSATEDDVLIPGARAAILTLP